MSQAPSKSEANRRDGKHQIDEQRASILDAAERLFLENGLENTKMVDIAAQAGITKVTLYRYFPNRDVIALEIHVRMMQKIDAVAGLEDHQVSFASAKKLALSMIRNFGLLRDAYRYMGMFDTLYLDHPPDAPLTQWTKNQLIASAWGGAALNEQTTEIPQRNRLVMVLNAVVWFLEKLALRGELTWSDQAIPLEEHLKLFEEMIVGYIERFLDTEDITD